MTKSAQSITSNNNIIKSTQNTTFDGNMIELARSTIFDDNATEMTWSVIFDDSIKLNQSETLSLMTTQLNWSQMLPSMIVRNTTFNISLKCYLWWQSEVLFSTTIWSKVPEALSSLIVVISILLEDEVCLANFERSDEIDDSLEPDLKMEEKEAKIKDISNFCWSHREIPNLKKKTQF